MSAWTRHCDRTCGGACFYCKRDGRREQQVELAQKPKRAMTPAILAALALYSGVTNGGK